MPDHLGRNRRLVDEDETRRVKPGLLELQFGTRCSDIRTILFGGVAVAPKDDLAQVRPGHIGNELNLKHGLQPRAERVVEGLQGFLLQVEVSKVIS